MATSKILLGPIPHARYDWVSGASYGKEAIVFHKGSSYIALSDNPSTEPSFTYDPATGSYNVPAGWGLLAVGAEIVQETGDSQDKAMSQKAVTDALTASDQKLSELESEVSELDAYVLGEASISPIKGFISAAGTWYVDDSHSIKVFNIQNCKQLLLYGNGFAFLKSFSEPIHGGQIDFTDNEDLYGRKNFSTKTLIEKPDDTNYLVINYRDGNSIRTFSIELDGVDINKGACNIALDAEKEHLTKTILNANVYLNTSDYLTLSQVISGIAQKDRRFGLVVFYRESNNVFRQAIYTKSLVDDEYWSNESNWQVFETDSSFNAKINKLDQRTSQYYPSSEAGKAWRIGNPDAIGSEAIIYDDVNEVITRYCVTVNTGEIYNIKGEGASGPRLFFIVDEQGILKGCAEANSKLEIRIQMPCKGTLYVNVRNDTESFHVYREVPWKKNIVSGNRWVALGDSITEGYISKIESPGYELKKTEGWVYKLAAEKEVVVKNAGVGGTGFIRNHSGVQDAGWQVAKSIDFSQYNIATIAFGVNDWKYDCPLGTFDDDFETPTTIYGGIRSTLETIIASNPLCKIYVISPINCAVVGTESSNWGIGTAYPNSGTLEQVFQAIKSCCEYYGVEMIDMLHNSIVNRKNIKSCLLDNVHPTPDTHTIMAKEIGTKLYL